MLFISHGPARTRLAQLLRTVCLDKNIRVFMINSGPRDGEILRCSVFVAFIDEEWARLSLVQKECSLLQRRLSGMEMKSTSMPKVICVFLDNMDPSRLSADYNITENATILKLNRKQDQEICNEVIPHVLSTNSSPANSAPAYNIMLIGDSSVGKSSLLLRTSQGKFEETLAATIGIDHKRIKLKVGGKMYDCNVWDTAGQERYDTVSAAYFRKADGIIIVYDITRRSSFDNVEKWLDRVESFAPEKTPCLLVGNKADLAAQRAVESRAISAKYADHRAFVACMEVSARTGAHVEEAFQALVRLLVDASPQGALKESDTSSSSVASRTQSFSLRPNEPPKKRSLLSLCSVL